MNLFLSGMGGVVLLEGPWERAEPVYEDEAQDHGSGRSPSTRAKPPFAQVLLDALGGGEVGT